MRFFQPIQCLCLGKRVYLSPNAHDKNPFYRRVVKDVLIPSHHSKDGYTEAKIKTDRNEVLTVTWYASNKIWLATTHHICEGE